MSTQGFGGVDYGANDAPELLIQYADAEMFANKQANRNRSGRTRAISQLAHAVVDEFH